MDVAALMTPDPYRIDSEASLDAALAEMDEHDVRHLVVEQAGSVVGVLSDRDLLQATGWMRSASRARRPGGENEPRTVGDIAHAHPVTIHPDDSVVSAAVELSGRGIGCLPVMKDGRLVGILTEMDMVEGFKRAVQSGKLVGEADPAVEEVMRRSVTTTTPSTTLAQARALCGSIDVRHLPVLEDEALVGMLSDRDLRRAAGQGRSDETTVEEVMSRELVTIGSQDPLSRAATLIRASKVSSLPVVEEGRLVGLITVTDLVDRCLESLREPEA